MQPDIVFERVRDTMVNCQHFDVDRITIATRFDEIEMDSLDAFELIILLEEEFNIQIDMNLAKSASSIGDIVNHIKGKTADGNYRA